MEQRSRQIESNKSIFLHFDRVGVYLSGHLAEAFWQLLWKLGPLQGLLLTDSLTSLKPLPLRVFLFDFFFAEEINLPLQDEFTFYTSKVISRPIP